MPLVAWLIAVFGVTMIVTLSKIMEPVRHAFDWLTWRPFAPSADQIDKWLSFDSVLCLAASDACKDGRMAVRHAVADRLFASARSMRGAEHYDVAVDFEKAAKSLKGSSLLECAQCTGFWVGILAFVAHVPLPGTAGWPWYAAALASGGAASGFSWLMDLLTAKLAT